MAGQGNRLKQCEFCGELMSDTTGSANPVCQNCAEKDAEMFDRVKSKLQYGEKVSVHDIAQRTGVERKHIERWVRTGRLGSVEI